MKTEEDFYPEKIRTLFVYSGQQGSMRIVRSNVKACSALTSEQQYQNNVSLHQEIFVSELPPAFEFEGSSQSITILCVRHFHFASSPGTFEN